MSTEPFDLTRLDEGTPYPRGATFTGGLTAG